MKKFYILFLFILHSFYSTSQNYFTQYFDGADTSITNSLQMYFEPGNPNVWQIGPPQKLFFSAAATTPNAILTDTINFYPDTNTSRFQVRFPADTSLTFGIYAMQWEQKLDLDFKKDVGILEFSVDGGTTWDNAFGNPYVYNFYGFNDNNMDTTLSGDIGFTGTDVIWKNIWICFDVSWMTLQVDTVRVRFSLVSDSINTNSEGWMLDNMLAHPTFIHTIAEKEQEKYLNVYPNPSGTIVHIEAKKLKEFHIIEKMELYDLNGRIVEEWKNIPTKFWIDVSRYANGLYYLKIRTNKKSETLPMVVSKP